MGGTSAPASRVAPPSAPNPMAPPTAGQAKRRSAPSPITRNPNDCNKTDCVDNGGG